MMSAMAEIPDLLLVDDDEGDRQIMLKTIHDSKIFVHIHEVENGDQALKFLRKEAPYENMPSPDLVLLDLNMPRKDGRETLKEIKQDPVLRKTPVVILTTSAAEIDIARSYALGANCYIKKPLAVAEFAQVVKDIEYFWLALVKLPPK